MTRTHAGWRDPAERMQNVRDAFARETAKLPAVDHNGHPLPARPLPESAPEEPGPRLPAPNPALGSSGGGPPDYTAQIRDAQARGDWATVMYLQRLPQA